MIRRLYVNNFRCLENFDLKLDEMHTALLIGRNGSGKTTVTYALEVLQRIARGTNRVGELIKPADLAWGRAEAPARFEIEVGISDAVYHFVVAFEFPKNFKEMRILEEKLTVDGEEIYSRSHAAIRLAQGAKVTEFALDWHLVALPIIQERSQQDPVFLFKQWMARLLILRPVPVLIKGESSDESLKPAPMMTDLAAWWAGLIAFTPSAYARIEAYLKQVMPDLRDIRNPNVGADTRQLQIVFKVDSASITLPVDALSDGEKCFLICSLVLAANQAYGPIACVWDEPDNYLALSEVGHFVVALRAAFEEHGQFVATSHNPEAIRAFPAGATHYLYRDHHLSPTRVRLLSEMDVQGDLIDALIRGDVEP